MDEACSETDSGGAGDEQQQSAVEDVVRMRTEIQQNGEVVVSISDDSFVNGIMDSAGDNGFMEKSSVTLINVTNEKIASPPDSDHNDREPQKEETILEVGAAKDDRITSKSSDVPLDEFDSSSQAISSSDDVVSSSEPMTPSIEQEDDDVAPQVPLKKTRANSAVDVANSEPIYDVPRSLCAPQSDVLDGDTQDGLDDTYDVPTEEDVADSEQEEDGGVVRSEPEVLEDLMDSTENGDTENVYEEIRRVGASRASRTSTPVDIQSAGNVVVDGESIFKRCSLVDEVMDEVERVQQKHDQVLQELNLDIENLIMPLSPMDGQSRPTSSSSVSEVDFSPLQQVPPRVPPHGTLPLNAGASTCCDNSSAPAVGAVIVEHKSCNSHANRVLPPLPFEAELDNKQHGYPRRSSITMPLKDREPSRRLSETIGPAQPLTPTLSGCPRHRPPSNWLSRLPSLSSFREKKSKSEKNLVSPSSSSSSSSKRFSWRSSFGYSEEPLYVLYDDSHRLHEGKKYNLEDEIYEDIDRHSVHRTLSSSTSGLSEDCSDTESLQSISAISVSSFKDRILHLGKKFGRQSENKTKDISKNKFPDQTDIKQEGKLMTKFFSKNKDYNAGKQPDKVAVAEVPKEDERLQQQQQYVASHNLVAILPPPPSDLTPEQAKRRYIVGTLVHSENSYIASLKRLVQDYKRPLEECLPPIINLNKISTLFHKIPEVLQIHLHFGISLVTCVRHWDKDEKIGNVFINTFSKSSVLDAYSDFINNFSSAMELAKQEAKRKSAFTDFLKMKQITSHDRLSFFGLMVKPVQRFPQFILLLQDLLRHTPSGHHDRLSLQLALTQMEMLAEMLNERKRESDQAGAVHSILAHVNAKLAARSLSEGSRYLLRQDTLTQLIFNQNGQLTKFKERCLFLLNDLLVCVNISTRHSSSDSKAKSTRHSLKWAVPVCDIEVQEDASPILNRLVFAMATGQSSATKGAIDEMGDVQSLYQDLNDLIHDFEVISRISSLVYTLRRRHTILSVDAMHQVSQSVQKAIQQKDEEVKWLDSCCLQFTLPLKSKTGKVQRQLVIFQTKSMDVKQEWMTDVRLAQLALDARNAMAWDFPDQERRPSTKVPLFVKAVSVLSAKVPMEVKCGCYHRTVSSRLPLRPQNFVWLCSTDGFNCHISVHTLRQMGIREVFSFDLMECRISSMESVPGSESPTDAVSLFGDTVWMGTESRRVVIYSGGGVQNFQEVGSANMSAPVLHIKYHLGQVYVALANGTLAVFKRSSGNQWQMKNFQVVALGSEPVTCLLSVNSFMYCGCGRQVWVLDSLTANIVHVHSVHHDHLGNIYTMAHSGIGLWLNLRNTPLVCLYHAETFQHLQDINVTSSVKKAITEESRPRAPRNIYVTVLTVSWGLLWIGTNVGIVLSIPLPRLQGIPMLGRRANMAYHAHVGPVSMVLVLQGPSFYPLRSTSTSANVAAASTAIADNSSASATTVTTTPIGLTHQDQLNKMQTSSGTSNEKLGGELQSLSNGSSKEFFLGDSLSSPGAEAKTLPRSWKPPLSQSFIGEAECDVYGLYGNLLNVKEDSSMTPLEEDLRSSDPELIPSLVSTLDRRLRLKLSRPRSFDLANLTTAGLSGSENGFFCASSGSEDGSSATISLAEIPETLVEEPAAISNSDLQVTSPHPAGTATTPNEQIASKGAAQHSTAQRSLLTLIGGRGYVDLRSVPMPPPVKHSANSAIAQNDAYVILWEMKI